MPKLPNIFKKISILLASSLVVSAFILFYAPLNLRTPALAGIECNGFCTGCTADWQDAPLSACERNLGSPNNQCCPSGGCSSECGTLGRWDWCYASGCQARGASGRCEEFQYRYNYQSCGAVDSCTGGNRLRAGLCDSGGCKKGGEYKICCQVDANGNYTGQPASSCSGGNFSGVCPSGSKPIIGSSCPRTVQQRYSCSGGTCVADSSGPYTSSNCDGQCKSGGSGNGGQSCSPRSCTWCTNRGQCNQARGQWSDSCGWCSNHPTDGCCENVPGAPPPPPPAPPSDCRSHNGCSWCTSPGQCDGSGLEGKSKQSGAGYCSNQNDIRCCGWQIDWGCRSGGGSPPPPPPPKNCSRNVCSGNRCRTENYQVSGGSSCNRSSQCSSDAGCCSAPSAPSLRSPSNGSTLTTGVVTLEWNHNNQWNCSAGRFRVYLEAGDTTPDNVVCDVDQNTRSCTAGVSDRNTYFWKVQAVNGAGQTRDSATWAFNVLFHAGGWFQVQDTDLANPGDLISQIPGQCSPPQCTPQFNLGGGGGYPGVPAYGGSSASFGEGSVSGEGWLANTGYSGRRFNYAFFSRNIPSGATQITNSSVSGGDLNSMAASDKVAFAVREGDLVITSTANFSNKKLALFVTGNLTIEDRITLNDGKGFFGAFVQGNINIHPQVSHPNNPALEGLFMADGTINTGTQKPAADNRLYVRGALVGWGGVNLQRDLDPTKITGANNLTPAEFVEYAPDLILTFPRELLREGLVWREVAP